MRPIFALFALVIIAAVPVQAASLNIVAFGASNTNGKGVSPSEAFPARVEAMLRARGVDANVSVVAVDGQDTADMLSSVDDVPNGTNLVLLEPDRGNDRMHGRSMEENAANLRAIKARLAQRGIRTIVLHITGLSQIDFQYDGVHFSLQGHQDVAVWYVSQILAQAGGRRSSRSSTRVH